MVVLQYLLNSNTTLVKVKSIFLYLFTHFILNSNTTLVKVKSYVVYERNKEDYNSNTTLVKVKWNTIDAIRNKLEIQIQLLLKLNSVELFSTIFNQIIQIQLLLKLNVERNLSAIQLSYSNTTLVKVKC